MGVDPASVDIRTNPPCSNMDTFESSISSQFAYFVRNARNIRLVVDSYNKVKKRKDWGLDPELVAHNIAFHNWPAELPAALQLVFQTDGSSPWLSSHFHGNMHQHHHLGIVMLHRPQLQVLASKSFATGADWKREMTICYNSAKMICRLQEAILAQFGLTGLLCMQRGISFTIYAILTCSMIHLVSHSFFFPTRSSINHDRLQQHLLTQTSIPTLGNILHDICASWNSAWERGLSGTWKLKYMLSVTPFPLTRTSRLSSSHLSHMVVLLSRRTRVQDRTHFISKCRWRRLCRPRQCIRTTISDISRTIIIIHRR